MLGFRFFIPSIGYPSYLLCLFRVPNLLGVLSSALNYQST